MVLDRIVSSEAWIEFVSLISSNIESGQTAQHFEKQLRLLVERHDWRELFPIDDRLEFSRRADIFRHTEIRRRYMTHRLDQLNEANFKFRVYRHGGSHRPTPQHISWDGLVLPSDHPFWQSHFPPNGFGCSCRVFGARSLSGAERRGGNVEKILADSWDHVSAETGAPDGVHPLFIGQSAPGPELVLPYVLAGTAKSDMWG